MQFYILIPIYRARIRLLLTEWRERCLHGFAVPPPVVQLSSMLWEVGKIAKDNPIINAVSLH